MDAAERSPVLEAISRLSLAVGQEGNGNASLHAAHAAEKCPEYSAWAAADFKAREAREAQNRPKTIPHTLPINHPQTIQQRHEGIPQAI